MTCLAEVVTFATAVKSADYSYGLAASQCFEQTSLVLDYQDSTAGRLAVARVALPRFCSISSGFERHRGSPFAQARTSTG